METKFTLKRITLFTAIALFFFNLSYSQAWSYLGGNCCIAGNTNITQSIGSAETFFKANGNTVTVGFGSNPSTVVVKEFDGSNWNAYAPFVTSGIVGGFDAEVYNDELYVAVINNGLVVRKYNGATWVDVGSKVNQSFSTTNYDFAIDNSGTPYIARFDRKLYKFDGTDWVLTYTFPQTSGATIFSYGFTGDNTLVFDANNYLAYIVGADNKQFLKSYDGTAESLIGDTISKHLAFAPYNIQLFKNGSSIFAALSGLNYNTHIKKLDGNVWALYGDTTGWISYSGNSLMTFGVNGVIYYTISGSTAKTVFTTTGSTIPFSVLDTISHSGFAQFTDLDVNPADGKLHATFNSLNGTAMDFSIMKYDGTASVIGSNQFASVIAFPNPVIDYVSFSNIDLLEAEVVLTDLNGRTVPVQKILPATISLSGLAGGVYLAKIRHFNTNRLYNFRLVKQ